VIKVLFVCYANICRSPMAEGIFQHLLEKNALTEKVSTDSAGTHSNGGKSAHPNTLEVLTENGIAYSGISRRLTVEDFYQYDYILAMDKENLHSIRALQPDDTKATIALLLDYAQNLPFREVADPYVTGRYHDTFDVLENGLQGFLKALRGTHQL
jgi:protein-tyrosine phosphatase